MLFARKIDLSFPFSYRLPLKVALFSQDGFEQATVLILDNVTLCGSYDTNLLKWHSHGLQNMFLQTSLNVKLPSIPWGNLSNIPVNDQYPDKYI